MSAEWAKIWDGQQKWFKTSGKLPMDLNMMKGLILQISWDFGDVNIGRFGPKCSWFWPKFAILGTLKEGAVLLFPEVAICSHWLSILNYSCWCRGSLDWWLFADTISERASFIYAFWCDLSRRNRPQIAMKSLVVNMHNSNRIESIAANHIEDCVKYRMLKRVFGR